MSSTFAVYFQTFRGKKKGAEVNLVDAGYWQKQFKTRFILHPPPRLKSISKKHFFLVLYGELIPKQYEPI